METLYDAAHNKVTRRMRDRQRLEAVPVLIVSLAAIWIVAFVRLSLFGVGLVLAVSVPLLFLMLIYVSTSTCVRLTRDNLKIPIRRQWRIGRRQYYLIRTDEVAEVAWDHGASEIVVRTKQNRAFYLPETEVPGADSFVRAMDELTSAQ